MSPTEAATLSVRPRESGDPDLNIDLSLWLLDSRLRGNEREFVAATVAHPQNPSPPSTAP
jgi:hypothetical protein